MITIEILRHFVAVVNNNGINRAAEQMFISPSSLTRAIQLIEAELGYSLFDRIGRNIQLNKQGLKFFEETKEVITKFEGLLTNQDLEGKALFGHYMIGGSHFLCKHILPKVLSRLASTYKNATFGVYSFDSSILIKKVHMGELDMGISFSLRASEAMDSEFISTGQMYLCGSKKHPLADAPFSEVKKHISHYPAIMHRPSESVERCDNHPVFKAHGIQPKIQLFWDSDFFALDVMAQDHSWSLLPDIVIDSDPRIVKFKHPKNWSAPYDLKVFWNKRKPNDILKAAFLEV